jgi:MinD-like ATPase involved in chromosome partitioning or flagellar assembly
MAAHGAVAFFTTPLTPGLVAQITRQAPELVARAREGWRKPLVDGGVAARTVEAAGALAYRAGVFVFWSGKGGDGKTSLAVNVACLQALVGNRRVLLVDADMNCGRVALHLDLAPGQNTLFHLASDYRAAGNRLDARMLQRRVVAADRALDPRTKVVESRLDVVLGLTQIQQASSEDLFGRQFVHDLLRLGRELYDFVIVDLGSSTQMGPHFGALQAADSVLLVNTSDRSSLYYNREILRALVREADLRPDKFKLVINRYDPDDRLDLKDVAEFMGLPVFAVVPENRGRAMTAAINQGRPFVLDHMGRNPPEAEATLRGLLAVAEGLYPPLGTIIAERNGRVGKRGLFQRGAR